MAFWGLARFGAWVQAHMLLLYSLFRATPFDWIEVTRFVGWHGTLLVSIQGLVQEVRAWALLCTPDFCGVNDTHLQPNSKLFVRCIEFIPGTWHFQRLRLEPATNKLIKCRLCLEIWLWTWLHLLPSFVGVPKFSQQLFILSWGLERVQQGACTKLVVALSKAGARYWSWRLRADYF